MEVLAEFFKYVLSVSTFPLESRMKTAASQFPGILWKTELSDLMCLFLCVLALNATIFLGYKL